MLVIVLSNLMRFFMFWFLIPFTIRQQCIIYPQEFSTERKNTLIPNFIYIFRIIIPKFIYKFGIRQNFGTRRNTLFLTL